MEKYGDKTKLHPGMNFRIFRKILNKTQDELAAEMNVCKATVSNFERGYTYIKPNYLYYMYTTYGLNISWLMTGKGNIFSLEDGKPPADIVVNKKYLDLFEFMKIPDVEKAIMETLKKVKPIIEKEAEKKRKRRKEKE
ncbi:MAG: helix-turn-helix transcriptional regulator [Candidatus Aminicenantes bacterium]|nr:helix-turn-helix transcriptional regulator [Candidatus Aminicenantes bacterium]